MKQLVFLYPVPEIINWEIQNHSFGYIDSEEAEQERNERFKKKRAETKSEQEKFAISEEAKKEMTEVFKPFYKRCLNECIDVRYRRNKFVVNYVLFKNSSISDVIDIHGGDRIIETEVDFETHTKHKKYPRLGRIIQKLGDTEKLVVTGFHLWDCVQRVARSTYRHGIDVLVDEDMTQLFGNNIQNPDFDLTKFPGNNLEEFKRQINRGMIDKECIDLFLKAREKPWMHKYPELREFAEELK